MRNPIRLKNLRWRFLPYYVLGGLVLYLVTPTPWALAVGSVLVGAGAALRTWGAGHLVKNDRLTITGPYARLRHPLYLGTLLTAVGFAVSLGGWITVAILAAVVPWFALHYFPRKERSEGGRLEEIYGDDFRLYRSNVPALLPRFRPWRPEAGSLRFADPTLRWDGHRYSDNNELGTLLAQIGGVAVLTARMLSGL